MSPQSRPLRYPLVRRPTSALLDDEEFARRCGLHPELVRRFWALGLIPAARHARRVAVVQPGAGTGRRAVAAPARRPAAQLRRPRTRVRPPRPDHRPRDRPARSRAHRTGATTRHHPAADRQPTGAESAMDLNRLTQKSQQALSEAQDLATRAGHTEVDGEHLLARAPRPARRAGAPAARRDGRRCPGAALRPGGRARPQAPHDPAGAPAGPGRRSPSGWRRCSTPPTGRHGG